MLGRNRRDQRDVAYRESAHPMADGEREHVRFGRERLGDFEEHGFGARMPLVLEFDHSPAGVGTADDAAERHPAAARGCATAVSCSAVDSGSADTATSRTIGSTSLPGAV